MFPLLNDLLVDKTTSLLPVDYSAYDCLRCRLSGAIKLITFFTESRSNARIASARSKQIIYLSAGANGYP